MDTSVKVRTRRQNPTFSFRKCYTPSRSKSSESIRETEKWIKIVVQKIYSIFLTASSHKFQKIDKEVGDLGDRSFQF